MVKDLLLGVDIGTQGVKCSLFSIGGEQLSAAFKPSKLYQPEPGITEEDPEFQLESVCSAIAECIAPVSSTIKNNIACIAIDGQMAGVIGIGEDGMAVTPYDSWLDTRCAPYITRMIETAGDEVLQKSGTYPSFNHGPKILWWKHEYPEIYKKIVSFVQPAGYVSMRLCGLQGKDAFIDTTYLHFSGFADTEHSCWDNGLLSTFAIDKNKLPQIVKPNTLIGHLSPEMVAACGLPHTLPVAAGCGDTAASFLSCGAVRPGIGVDVSGTASVFAATTDTYCCDTKNLLLSCGASVTPGLWHPYAYINGGGLNLEWFACDILNLERNNKNRFADLNPMVLQPHAEDPLFIPHMGGRVSPNQPALRGTFAGLQWKHSHREMFSAIIESVALEYGIYKKALLSILPDTSITELRITGGGDSSSVWKEMKATVLQAPVVSIQHNYGAPMGSAIVAGWAVGLFDSTVEASDAWIKTASKTQPHPDYYEFYQNRLQRYEKLLVVMDEFYRGIR